MKFDAKTIGRVIGVVLGLAGAFWAGASQVKEGICTPETSQAAGK